MLYKPSQEREMAFIIWFVYNKDRSIHENMLCFLWDVTRIWWTTERISFGALNREGYEFTDDEQAADIIIINTCCFTQ